MPCFRVRNACSALLCTSQRVTDSHSFLTCVLPFAAMCGRAAVTMCRSRATRSEALSTADSQQTEEGSMHATHALHTCSPVLAMSPPPPSPLCRQVEVDFTARVADTGKVYDGSRGFEFTLGQDEASRCVTSHAAGRPAVRVAVRLGGSIWDRPAVKQLQGEEIAVWRYRRQDSQHALAPPPLPAFAGRARLGAGSAGCRRRAAD